MYICTYMYVYVCICAYMYIYTHRCQHDKKNGKGQNKNNSNHTDGRSYNNNFTNSMNARPLSTRAVTLTKVAIVVFVMPVVLIRALAGLKTTTRVTTKITISTTLRQ